MTHNYNLTKKTSDPAAAGLRFADATLTTSLGRLMNSLPESSTGRIMKALEGLDEMAARVRTANHVAATALIWHILHERFPKAFLLEVTPIGDREGGGFTPRGIRGEGALLLWSYRVNPSLTGDGRAGWEQDLEQACARLEHRDPIVFEDDEDVWGFTPYMFAIEG